MVKIKSTKMIFLAAMSEFEFSAIERFMASKGFSTLEKAVIYLCEKYPLSTDLEQFYKDFEAYIEDDKTMVEWLSIKEQYPDALLLFRCGDYYEAYKEDAEVCERVLGVTLTKQQGVKTIGFPFHALDTYLPKLVRSGHRVAICDDIKK